MTHDEIDRVLSREAEILPSSGFAAVVMQSVRQEAAFPPPIPFPWKRALPGMITLGGALIYGLIELAVQPGTEPARSSLPWRSLLTPVVNVSMSPQAGWVAFAMLLALASVLLSNGLASRET